MLVRSPRLTSNKWRGFVSSGRLVCKYHVVVLWGYVCCVLFRFRRIAFTEATVLCLIVLRYACAPTATRSYLTTVCALLCVCLFFFLFLFFFGDAAFSKYFCTKNIFSLYGECVVRFFLPGDILLPCDHGLRILHHFFFVKIQSINWLQC